jgi:hypothetical protein
MSWLKKHVTWLKWILAVAILSALIWFNGEGLKDLGSRKIVWAFWARRFSFGLDRCA